MRSICQIEDCENEAQELLVYINNEYLSVCKKHYKMAHPSKKITMKKKMNILWNKFISKENTHG